MINRVDLLTEADKMGDGDHGVGMKRGFAAVKEILGDSGNPGNDCVPSEVLIKTGTTLIESVGGAAGVIFGTMFRGWGKAIAGMPQMDSAASEEVEST